MQIKKVPVKDLVSPDWNPRQITTEELEKLKTSLEEFGYIEPIIVNDVNNHVFGGTGTTLIACEQLHRQCYMMELSPKYCQVIINRWEEYTGRKAEKLPL